MNVFKKYALFYDSFYKEKNYEAECDFLENVFSSLCKRKINSILDLGCGTGSHSILLAKKGFHLTGVDQAKEMINQAKEKALKENLLIEFINADIKKIDLNRKYDAVILMFAVLSYQTNNSDIEAVFKTIKQHLNPKGIFFFDCWFGPAVISQGPTDRIKEINLVGRKIIRIARPTFDIMNNVVSVNYIVFNIKSNKIINTTRECHRMRFFFPQEIQLFANHAGLKILKICPFMSLKNRLSFNDWNMAVIGSTI